MPLETVDIKTEATKVVVEPKKRWRPLHLVKGAYKPSFTTTRSPLANSNRLEFLRKVTQHLLNQTESRHFRKPVNVKNIPNYYKEIKHPMDLNTIKKRLLNNYYPYGARCIKNFKTLFTNCFNFYQPTDQAYKDGKTLEALLEKRLRKYPTKEEIFLVKHDLTKSSKIPQGIKGEVHKLKADNIPSLNTPTDTISMHKTLNAVKSDKKSTKMEGSSNLDASAKSNSTFKIPEDVMTYKNKTDVPHKMETIKNKNSACKIKEEDKMDRKKYGKKSDIVFKSSSKSKSSNHNDKKSDGRKANEEKSATSFKSNKICAGEVKVKVESSNPQNHSMNVHKPTIKKQNQCKSPKSPEKVETPKIKPKSIKLIFGRSKGNSQKQILKENNVISPPRPEDNIKKSIDVNSEKIKAVKESEPNRRPKKVKLIIGRKENNSISKAANLDSSIKMDKAPHCPIAFEENTGVKLNDKTHCKADNIHKENKIPNKNTKRAKESKNTSSQQETRRSSKSSSQTENVTLKITTYNVEYRKVKNYGNSFSTEKINNENGAEMYFDKQFQSEEESHETSEGGIDSSTSYSSETSSHYNPNRMENGTSHSKSNPSSSESSEAIPGTDLSSNSDMDLFEDFSFADFTRASYFESDDDEVESDLFGSSSTSSSLSEDEEAYQRKSQTFSDKSNPSKNNWKKRQQNYTEAREPSSENEEESFREKKKYYSDAMSDYRNNTIKNDYYKNVRNQTHPEVVKKPNDYHYNKKQPSVPPYTSKIQDPSTYCADMNQWGYSDNPYNTNAQSLNNEEQHFQYPFTNIQAPGTYYEEMKQHEHPFSEIQETSVYNEYMPKDPSENLLDLGNLEEVCRESQIFDNISESELDYGFYDNKNTLSQLDNQLQRQRKNISEEKTLSQVKPEMHDNYNHFSYGSNIPQNYQKQPKILPSHENLMSEEKLSQEFPYVNGNSSSNAYSYKNEIEISENRDSETYARHQNTFPIESNLKRKYSAEIYAGNKVQDDSDRKRPCYDGSSSGLSCSSSSESEDEEPTKSNTNLNISRTTTTNHYHNKTLQKNSSEIPTTHLSHSSSSESSDDENIEKASDKQLPTYSSAPSESRGVESLEQRNNSGSTKYHQYQKKKSSYSDSEDSSEEEEVINNQYGSTTIDNNKLFGSESSEFSSEESDQENETNSTGNHYNYHQNLIQNQTSDLNHWIDNDNGSPLSLDLCF